MSMSTKIKDLPTPFVETEPKTTAVQVQAQPQAQPQVQPEVQPQSEQVTATITPKHLTTSHESFWSRLQGELSEENVLIYIFLYLSALPEISRYLEIPGMPRGIAYKCFVLLVAYIFVKLLVLPHLKL
jgi:hypothetical protein